MPKVLLAAILSTVLSAPTLAQQASTAAEIRRQVPYSLIRRSMPRLALQEYTQTIRDLASARRGRSSRRIAPTYRRPMPRQSPKRLGRLSANPYLPDSTANPYGRYGNRYAPNSLKNPYGRYGNRRVAQPRRGGARAGRPGARGTRTIVVRRGRYYSPYYYGIGYGYGYPYYGGGYYGGSYSYTGSVRLKVKPRAAEVLVDGYYVGTVDDFDGTFQSLKLEPGPASIEIRAPGFEALRLDVRVLPGRKITFEENMRAGDPGEAPPPSAVHLRVEPRHARVFVDGYYVGTVDDFDGGRGLPLESGPQSIEIRADGYESLQLQVRILPDETITYEGDLTAAPGRQA